MLFAIILGGLIGSAFGGFVGFIIGGAIGGFLLNRIKSRLIGKLQNIQSGFVESVFAVMGAVCKADGVVSQNEIAVAEAMFTRFRLNESQKTNARAAFNRGKAREFDLDAELQRFMRVSGGQRSSGQQTDDAYKVLGVSPQDSDDNIKKVYRKLMSENHPDKLAGRGLPESMREMAEERTGEITHAYDVIKNARSANG